MNEQAIKTLDWLPAVGDHGCCVPVPWCLSRFATGKAQWDVQTAFLTMLILVIISEVISTATKAFVPSMFITAVLFVLSFWTYLPADILQQASIASFLPSWLPVMVVIGTMLDIQELIDQWKPWWLPWPRIAGILVVILTVGTDDP